MKEPSFWDKWEWARAHQKPEPKLVLDNARAVEAPKVPVLLDTPKVVFEDRSRPLSANNDALGQAFCRVAIPAAKNLIEKGGQFEDAGLKGVVAGGALAGLGGIMGGPPGAVPGGLLAGASLGVGGLGSVGRGLGAGLLWVATGDARPALSAGISQATGKFAPPLAQPYVDYAVEKGLNSILGPEKDPQCRW